MDDKVREVAWEGLVGLVAGSLVGVVLWFLGVVSVAAGEGSSLVYLLWMVVPTISVIGIVIWPVLGLVAGLAERRRAALAGLVLIAAIMMSTLYHVLLWHGYSFWEDAPLANEATLLGVAVWLFAVTGAVVRFAVVCRHLGIRRTH